MRSVILIDLFALRLHIFPPLVPSSITTTWGAITHPRDFFLPIVTLTAVRAVYPVMETTVATGREVLQTLVESIKTVGFANYYQIGTGAQLTLVLCPEHAAEMAAAGLTKADVRAYIFQEARMPMRRLKGIAHYGNRNWPAWIDENGITNTQCVSIDFRNCTRAAHRDCAWQEFQQIPDCAAPA